MRTLYLVSCSKQKLQAPGPHPAQDLYCSDLFVKSRAYVEAQLRPGDAWAILSAKHGALHPATPIEAYDQSLAQMSRLQRETWATLLWVQTLFPLLSRGAQRWRVVFFTGLLYQRELRRCIEGSSLRDLITLDDPLEGLEIGQRLSWLNAHLPKLARTGRTE